MKRYTHAWVACRAAALLRSERKPQNLVATLDPHLHHAAVGSWIPDCAEMNVAGFTALHHVFQIMPLPQRDERFVSTREDLTSRMSGSPYVRHFLKEDSRALTILTDDWWNQAYRCDPNDYKDGMHLPNRIMGLSTMLKDLVVLGDDEVHSRIRRNFKSLADIDIDVRLSSRQLAYFFFFLSHYVTDACMPCHCDGRDYIARSKRSIHANMEARWEKIAIKHFKPFIGDSSIDLMDKAKELDDLFGAEFTHKVPDLASGRDAWHEGIDSCRCYFSVMAVIAPPDRYPYLKEHQKVSIREVLPNGSQLFKDVTRLSLSDAVHNTAMLWKDAWLKATT